MEVTLMCKSKRQEELRRFIDRKPEFERRVQLSSPDLWCGQPVEMTIYSPNQKEYDAFVVGQEYTVTIVPKAP